MSTYKTARKAIREHKLSKYKEGYKQLSNFQNILNNMNTLYEKIESFDGIISNDKLDEIAHAINLEHKLSLTEEQVKMVTKRYE